MRLGSDVLGKRRREPRLADARLAGDQHHPPFAALRLLPAAESSSTSSSRPTSGVSPAGEKDGACRHTIREANQWQHGGHVAGGNHTSEPARLGVA